MTEEKLNESIKLHQRIVRYEDIWNKLVNGSARFTIHIEYIGSFGEKDTAGAIVTRSKEAFERYIRSEIERMKAEFDLL